MLTQLKRIVAIAALFVTVMSQASIAGALAVTGPSSGSSGQTTQTNTVNGTQFCNVWGCQNVGGQNTANNSGTTNSGSTNTTNTVGNPCAYYGTNCQNSGTSGLVGSTAGQTKPTNTVNATQYCAIYGCQSTSNNGGNTGNNGTNTGNTNVGPTQPTTTLNGAEYCAVYGCPNGSPTQPTTTVYGPEYCAIYGCPNQNPGYSSCNNNRYPNDIDGHWAEIYVRRLYDLCIFEGYADGSFRPQQNITRAELVKIALYAAGIPKNPGCYDADCGSPFMDLDMWQGFWIRPAWDRHIVQGYSANRFAPNQAITRAEATKVILSAYGFGPLNTGKSFFNDVSGWSTGWIEQAHELGIVQGIGNGNFDPERPITRAEAAKIIAKAVEKEDTHIN